jgi:hypothetical protein
MPPSSPEDEATIRPHPLARALIDRLGSSRRAAVIDFAVGSGRNSAALREAGFTVFPVDDAAAQSNRPMPSQKAACTALLSSHGFLHGTRQAIEERLHRVAQWIEPGGLLYATFGSTNDARFGTGDRIDASTFAPNDGDERGVAHAFFTEPELCALLQPVFDVELMEERAVDEVAGAWAHRQRPLSRAVHWFVIAKKRS